MEYACPAFSTTVEDSLNFRDSLNLWEGAIWRRMDPILWSLHLVWEGYTFPEVWEFQRGWLTQQFSSEGLRFSLGGYFRALFLLAKKPSYPAYQYHTHTITYNHTWKITPPIANVKKQHQPSKFEDLTGFIQQFMNQAPSYLASRELFWGVVQNRRFV